MIRSRLTYANVVATLALLLAVGLGGAYAAQVVTKNTVASSSIQKGAVKSSDLRNGGVKGKDVADGGITGADVAGDSLTGNDLDESSLSEVPSAQRATSASAADNAGLLGGIGAENLVTARSAHQPTSACGTTSAYSDCVRVTIDLARPQRLLLIATAEWNTLTDPPTGGDCLLERDDNGTVLAQRFVRSTSTSVGSNTFDFALNTVTPPVPAGSHFVDLSCREDDPTQEVVNAELSAVAVGAG